MKLVYTLIITVLCFSTFSQTKKIAHKSHSGSMDFFDPSGDDSFGLPPMEIDSLIWYNDTTVIQVSSIGGNWHVQKDTLINHPVFSDSAMTVDSLKNYYYRNGNTTFIGFENKCEAPIILGNDAETSSSIIVDDTRPERNGQVELKMLNDTDASKVDTLAKPKEHIKSRNEMKEQSLIPSSGKDDNTMTPFQLLILSLFGLSVVLFIVINKMNGRAPISIS